MNARFPFVQLAPQTAVTRPAPPPYVLRRFNTLRRVQPVQRVPLPPPAPLFALRRCVPRGGYQPGVDCRLFAADAPSDPRADVFVMPANTIVELLAGPWVGSIPHDDRFGRYAVPGPFAFVRWQPAGGPPILGWVQTGALYPV